MQFAEVITSDAAEYANSTQVNPPDPGMITSSRKSTPLQILQVEALEGQQSASANMASPQLSDVAPSDSVLVRISPHVCPSKYPPK